MTDPGVDYDNNLICWGQYSPLTRGFMT
jgi:hypothetical protein